MDVYGNRIISECAVDLVDPAKYLAVIKKTIDMRNNRYLTGQGLMELFRTDNIELEQRVYDKVLSAMPTVEKIDGKLYGVTELELSEPLDSDEWSALKNYIAKQMTDGYGEILVHNGIGTGGDGLLYISFWAPSSDYFIDIQQEHAQRLALESGYELGGGSI